MKISSNLKRKERISFPFLALTVIGLAFTMCQGLEQDKSSIQLEAGFVTPPDSAKPRVWWHWMNGNITKEGIDSDLKWMHRVGIGGFQNFDAALMTPQIVNKRLVYMTPEWKDAFQFTTKLADSLGLEMAIAGSPGWSESGGPWVKPEQAMKKLVWSETRIEGGKPFSGTLPKPPNTTGQFQNLTLREGFTLTSEDEVAPPVFYADAAVVAYKLPDADMTMNALQAKVTSSGGTFNLEALTDGDLNTSILLPYTRPGENAWIMFGFDKPEIMQSLTIVGGGYAGRFGFGADNTPRSLEASNDGKTFNKIIDITVGGVEQKTLTFSSVTAKYFRFTWKTPQPQSGFNMGAMFGLSNLQMPKVPAGTKISELVLHHVARVNRFEEKAAFATATDLYSAATPEVKPTEAIQKAEVIDLSSKLNADGILSWTPPNGRWVVMRLGYSLSGHKNGPASPEATGLEVDKLNADHVKTYFTSYLDQYKDATGGLMGKKGLQYMITDSWEAGTQNWTDKMMTEFANRRGYEMLTWLPVFTGHIVESSEASDRFLWDFRKTLSELVAENHYDQLTDILNERGMKRYTESHESGRAFIGDGMEVKRTAAIPMSATWTPGGLDPGTEVAPRHEADVRESASVSHIYGQNLVAAESMTAIGSAWSWSPETLKSTADMELASGLNRFVIHTSVHQPVNDKIPGLGLGPFGQWFTRHETWGEHAGAWMTYLARSSFMLQQGKFVADVAYYYGEDNNITALFGQKLPDVPKGYNYDFVNADALVNVLSVADGKITTPSGMSYHVLALDPNSQNMTLKVLHKIREIVNAGANVCGPKPLQTPSLSDNPDEFKTIVNELWANENGENKVGKGTVYAGKSLKEVLSGLNILADFQYTKPQESTNLLYVHRKLGDIDFYWVNNRNERVEELEATFRMEGKSAEIWHPETGKIEKVSYSIADGVTKVPLKLQANDAVFVVFRNKAKGSSETIAAPTEKELVTVDGPWKVSFQAGRGAPATATFNSLTAWNENADNGIKYFSGTGTYTKAIQAPSEWLNEGSKIWLDLGNVKNLAEILLNGKSLGIVWKTPFRIELTSSLKQGENTLEIKVTNLWVNRLIGDQQSDVKTKITYTTMPFYQANSPLKESGLIGPVKILSKKK